MNLSEIQCYVTDICMKSRIYESSSIFCNIDLRTNTLRKDIVIFIKGQIAGQAEFSSLEWEAVLREGKLRILNQPNEGLFLLGYLALDTPTAVLATVHLVHVRL